MARQQEMRRQPSVAVGHGRGLKSRGSLEADIIIANAPDPVFVSDLEGKILQANDAVSQLLGFQQDEVLELNNPLNNIGLFVGNAVDLIELAVADKSKIVGELRHAMEQVGKATAIISHLRTFGRAAPASRELMSLRHVIERALSLMQQQLRLREIEVTVDLGSEEAMVVGNAIQLEQVFINILTNARDAVADSTRKAIRISGSVSCVATEVVFADTGPGIPHGLERRIFDPFFTTKEVGKGTGLGLSIAYGIVKEHGGTISVASRPGEGATFLIHLPIASATGDEISQTSAPVRTEP
jgi:C4-dicarboxylate-specific signal transduction histidine kinase